MNTTNLLALSLLVLLLLCVIQLAVYRYKFGRPFWRSPELSEQNLEAFHFIQRQQSEFNVDEHPDVSLLVRHQFRLVAVFQIPVIANAQCVLLKNHQRAWWASCFLFNNRSFIAFTGLLKNTNKPLMITNFPGPVSQKQSRLLRLNKPNLSVSRLLGSLSQINVSKRPMPIGDYLQLFKKTFLENLIEQFQQEMLAINTVAPSLYLSSQRERLFKQYSKKYNIRTRSLQKQNNHILIINSQESIDYLMSRLVIQVPALHPKRAALIESAKQAADIRAWFRRLNERLDKTQRFIYMGEIDKPLASDFYLCQQVSVADQA